MKYVDNLQTVLRLIDSECIINYKNKSGNVNIALHMHNVIVS